MYVDNYFLIGKLNFIHEFPDKDLLGTARTYLEGRDKSKE